MKIGSKSHIKCIYLIIKHSLEKAIQLLLGCWVLMEDERRLGLIAKRNLGAAFVDSKP